jgi:glucokinase
VPNVLAADIGGTRFRVALYDVHGRHIALREAETSVDPRWGGREWMLARLREEFAALRLESRDEIAACGVSFGGPVDFARQRVTSVHSPGWELFPLGEWVREVTGVRSLVDNDANLGAVGEYRFGAGRGSTSMVYVTISTGIGGGVISDGKLHRGRDSMAGEIGHIPLEPLFGPPCTCGRRGCLESLASGRAISRAAKDLVSACPKAAARMLELAGGAAEGITAKLVFRAAAEGDPAAAAIVGEAAYWIARALATVIRILNPDKIVLGGGVAQAGDRLTKPVHEALKNFEAPPCSYSTEIVIAELQAYSPLYGAAAMALDLA